MTFALVLLTALLIAGPASAHPASMIIAGLGGTASVGVVGAAFIRIGVAVALSALSQALVANQNQRPTGGGVRTQTLTAGDTTPQSFILGRYMTAGNLVAPEMSHGQNGDTRFLTRVVDLGDRAIEELESLIVDGRPVLLDGPVHPTFGRGVLQADYEGILWCKHYLGNQTTADSYLTSVYGSYPERPWQTDMIGRAIPYAILTMLWRDNPQTWQGRPVVNFVCKGIKLYDPRKDGSAGGTGAHRFNDSSTFEWTDNPVVMIYNILRGISIPGGFTFGGGFSAEDLPFATWAAAMNTCDQVVGSRKRYIAGYEVKIGTPDVGGDSPLDVIDELLKACSGQIADVGGTMLIRVGGPGLPVKFITDDDILRSSAQELDPFPPLEASHNGVHATFPWPQELWQAKEAPPRYDADAETRDGQRLIADLQLPAVPNAAQVQQLMNAWLKDDQRHRRHRIVLPPEGILINPLSVIDWTSPRNGYIGKAFEVGEVGIDPATLSTTLSLREVDPADYDWTTGQEITVIPPSLVPVNPGPQAVPDWTVTGVTINDAGGTPRLPAIRLGWSAPLPGVSAIRWQVRVANTGDVVAAGATSNVDQGFHLVSEGIIRNIVYEARARLVGPRETVWTSWLPATAPDVGPTVPAAEISGLIQSQQLADGIINTAKFAQGLTPVEIFATLPTTGNFAGRMVTIPPDYKIYRHTGSPSGAGGFTLLVDGNDIAANSIVAGSFQAGAIRANDIAANEIVASKIAIGDLTNLVLNSDLPDADGWVLDPEVEGPVDAPTGMIKARAFRFPGTITDTRYARWTAGVDAGQEYYIACEARAGGGTPRRMTVRLGVRWLNAAGGFISATTSDRAVLTNTVPTMAAWAVQAPANAARGQFLFGRANSGSELEGGHIGSPMVRRMSGGELIVDGAIFARHMTAGSITADNAAIANATVDTLQIRGQAVTIPIRAQVGGHLTIDQTGPWTKIVELVMNREGFATELSFSCGVAGFGDAVANFAFFRGNTLMTQFHHTVGSGGRASTCAYKFIDWNRGTGSTNFSVRARRGNVAPFNNNVQVGVRFLSAHQFKR